MATISITYNNLVIATLTAGQGISLSCGSTKMASDIIIESQDATATVVYKNETIARLAENEKVTLYCKDTIAQTNIIVRNTSIPEEPDVPTNQLPAPVIELDGTTLNIYDESGLAEEFEILVDGEVSGTVELIVKGTEGLEYTLSDDGTYYICSGIGTATDTDIVIANKYKGLPVTAIAYSAFYNKKTIINVIIPEGITSIGEGAFSSCSRLTGITIPDSVTSIGNEAFYGCSSLTSVNIPNNISIISDHLFNHCESLVTINIPNSVTIIEDYAFARCYKLKNINIPNSITYFGERVFEEDNNLQYNEYDNAYYLGDENNPYVVLAKLKSTSIHYCNIQENTKFIGTEAFEKFVYLQNITIPNSVKSIGSEAFNDCSNLESIIIGNSVTDIRSHVFWSCISLLNITFKGTIEEWNAISKGSGWKSDVPATKVICLDGEVSI